MRIWHTDDPDRGVQDSGLERVEIERGPDAGTLMVAATARRANVEVMFWPDSPKDSVEAQSAWDKLTAFLEHL